MSGVVKPRDITITAAGASPLVMKILAGQDVTWENTDSIPHGISPYSPTPIPSGGFFSHIFPTPGTFQFQVDGDPAKSGTIVITPSGTVT